MLLVHCVIGGSQAAALPNLFQEGWVVKGHASGHEAGDMNDLLCST